MEKNNELFLKQNSIFGCLIGGTFIFASLLFILAGKGIVVNAQFHNIIMMLTIFGIFIGVRKYRDEQLAGVISYGKEAFSSFASPRYAMPCTCSFYTRSTQTY